MFGLNEPKVDPTPTPSETTPTPSEPKPKRKRKTKVQVAQDMISKGQKLVDEGRARLDEIAKVKKKEETKKRLYPAAGNLLKIIDDLNLPEGITDEDFILALRLFVTKLRRLEREEKTAFQARVNPAIETLFGEKGSRDQATDVAIRILTGHQKAFENVASLRELFKKPKKSENS